MYLTEVSIRRPVVSWVMSLILIVFGVVFIISCSDKIKEHPSNQIFIFSSSEDSLLSKLYLDDFLFVSTKNQHVLVLVFPPTIHIEVVYLS